MEPSIETLFTAEREPAADATRQAVQLLQTARQDSHPLTKWQHATMAQAYLNVARRLAPESTIERATRTHVRALSRRIDAELQTASSAVYRTCGKLKPSDDDNDLPGDEAAAPMRRSRRQTWA